MGAFTMNDEFLKYKSLRAVGHDAITVYKVAEEDGLPQIPLIRMVREVFSLNLEEAKDVSIKASLGISLEEHLNNIAKELEQLFEKENKENLGSP
jgi:ribosomal protein L7/L12